MTKKVWQDSLQRVGAWCEPIACSRSTHHFRVEDLNGRLGSYVSRVKGKSLLELEVAYIAN